MARFFPEGFFPQITTSIHWGYRNFMFCPSLHIDRSEGCLKHSLIKAAVAQPCGFWPWWKGDPFSQSVEVLCKCTNEHCTSQNSSLSRAHLGFIAVRNSKSAGTPERRKIFSCKSGCSCRSKVGLFHTQGQPEQKLTVASCLSLSP